jgi:hypothetical protein
MRIQLECDLRDAKRRLGKQIAARSMGSGRKR